MAKKSTERPEYLSSVALIVSGTNLQPREVSALLRMRPSHAWARGEPKVIRGRRVGETVYEWGGWKKFLPPVQRRRPLPQQLHFWARALNGRVGAFSHLASLGYRCELNCFVSTSGTATIAFSPELQKTIGDLGLTLSMDVWVSP